MNTYSKFVSVIVPNYCHAKYLDQRIQSILNQTYQNFELIVLDDCSPDDGTSKAVIEKYRSNPHVSHIVYNEQNSGSTFKQWDKGISLAKGDLIWIAESDDFCEPTLLEVLVKEFKQNEKLTLAYTLLQEVDAEGNPIRYLCYTPSGVTRLKGSDYVRRYMTTCNHCANASAALFKKSVYCQIDKQFTTYKAGGDMLFWIAIAEQGDVAIVNKRLNYFRQHSVKVTGRSVRAGINTYEFKKTYHYIISHFNLTPSRKRLIKEKLLFQILQTEYETENVRQGLLDYWQLPHQMALTAKIKIKVFQILQNRLSIYL